jgi:hypothetical protein
MHIPNTWIESCPVGTPKFHLRYLQNQLVAERSDRFLVRFSYISFMISGHNTSYATAASLRHQPFVFVCYEISYGSLINYSLNDFVLLINQH